jgi:hypothetical protein
VNASINARAVLVALFVLLAFCGVTPAIAQTTEPQRDLGATITWLNVGSLDKTMGGIGGRIGYHVVDLLSLDGEANVFPTDDPVTGRKLQALGGAKLGSQSRVFGLFGKLRVGGMRFTKDFIAPGTVCIAVFPTPRECLAHRRVLALDYGSVVEIYPSDRSIVRVDVGTTYLWFGRQGGGGRTRTGNFQLSLGFARRF